MAYRLFSISIATNGLQLAAAPLVRWLFGALGGVAASCCYGSAASSAFGPAHCCKVVACCQWTSGPQNLARLFALLLLCVPFVGASAVMEWKVGRVFLGDQFIPRVALVRNDSRVSNIGWHLHHATEDEFRPYGRVVNDYFNQSAAIGPLFMWTPKRTRSSMQRLKYARWFVVFPCVYLVRHQWVEHFNVDKGLTAVNKLVAGMRRNAHANDDSRRSADVSQSKAVSTIEGPYLKFLEYYRAAGRFDLGINASLGLFGSGLCQPNRFSSLFKCLFRHCRRLFEQLLLLNGNTPEQYRENRHSDSRQGRRFPQDVQPAFWICMACWLFILWEYVISQIKDYRAKRSKGDGKKQD